MSPPDVTISDETLESLRQAILEEEKSQLHYERPPRIIMDLKEIIEEEVTEVNVDFENEN